MLLKNFFFFSGYQKFTVFSCVQIKYILMKYFLGICKIITNTKSCLQTLEHIPLLSSKPPKIYKTIFSLKSIKLNSSRKHTKLNDDAGLNARSKAWIRKFNVDALQINKNNKAINFLTSLYTLCVAAKALSRLNPLLIGLWVWLKWIIFIAESFFR